MNENQDFKPAWWLPTSHLQTLWPALFRRKPSLVVTNERVNLDDGDFIDLVWHGPKDKPLVLILHGLEGSISSHYAMPMMSALNQVGFSSVFMHFRNCSHEPNRLPRSYHSGETRDMHNIVEHIQDNHQRQVFAAIGFSLGGNALLKWLGETGDQNPLSCAAAVSVPFSLANAAAKLESGFSRLYQSHLLSSLRKSYKKKFSRLVSPLSVDVDSLKSFREFDDKVTAPLHGFDGVDDYYQKSSSDQFLKNIKKPTCIIHSRDDPFMYPHSIPAEDALSEHVSLHLTRHGGHVGFVSGNSPLATRYWHEKVICMFLQKHFQEHS